MKHETIKFVAKQYQHGWSVWIKADSKSMLLGSGIKNQNAVDTLVSNIELEKEPLLSRKEQQRLLKEMEELRAYKEQYQILKYQVDQISTPRVNCSEISIKPNNIF